MYFVVHDLHFLLKNGWYGMVKYDVAFTNGMGIKYVMIILNWPLFKHSGMQSVFVLFSSFFLFVEQVAKAHIYKYLNAKKEIITKYSQPSPRGHLY